MFDFVYKQQYVFLIRDYTTRISWCLTVKYIIGVKTLSWTYTSVKMIQNETETCERYERMCDTKEVCLVCFYWTP